MLSIWSCLLELTVEQIKEKNGSGGANNSSSTHKGKWLADIPPHNSKNSVLDLARSTLTAAILELEAVSILTQNRSPLSSPWWGHKNAILNVLYFLPSVSDSSKLKKTEIWSLNCLTAKYTGVYPNRRFTSWKELKRVLLIWPVNFQGQ